MSSASSVRKRRGVVRSSITRLVKRLKELEGEPDRSGSSDTAKQLVAKLESLDAEFKSLHFELIDLIDEGSEELEAEQVILDKHDDDVTAISVRLSQLVAKSATSASDGGRKASSLKLSRLERNLKITDDALSSLPGNPDDVYILEQHTEQLADCRRELSSIYEDLVSLGLNEDDDLFTLHVRLEEKHFNCGHRIKKLLSSCTSSASAPVADGKGVRLPKLEVPTFNGDVLHWKRFWEQFSVSVHKRTNLSSAEKLVYLQQAVKNGSAKNAIEGLSQSGDNYAEAIDCLTSRYDRPRLIHRAHVRVIMDAPPLKDGSGKELRRLHDVLQQHLRALKSMKCEPSGPFLTSIIELKLDVDTMFEWQKHSQATTEVPHYDDLLDFIDLRAQASETSLPASSKKQSKTEMPKRPSSCGPGQTVTFFAANPDHDPASKYCVLCHGEKHPLYVCPKFKAMSRDDKRSVVKIHSLCWNCLNSGHFTKACKCQHKCKKCQRPHHTLMHVESSNDKQSTQSPADRPVASEVTSNAAIRLKSSALLMTCRVLVAAPNGSSMEVRALLDNASSTSFVSERLAQTLCLPRMHQSIHVSGIAGSSPSSPIQCIASLQISPAHCNGRKIDITAVVVPKVTCDLPVHPVPFDLSWKHVNGLTLADPSFGQPGRIDILLGVDVFVEVLLHGRRTGLPGTPVALETEFGWVLSGSTEQCTPNDQINFQATTFHVVASSQSSDDLLRRFWEVEESPLSIPVLTMEERSVIQHFETNHHRTTEGRFVVPLPKRPDSRVIGESRSQAVRRFLSLEKSLTLKGRFKEFDAVMQEYLDLGHAVKVSMEDLEMDPSKVFYLPMHAVYKASSSTTKIRAVFDASAKSSTGVSLNDVLLVGPTVHPSLIDVLLRFRSHRIGLIADVSKMYRAIELVKSDQDLHRFVWRSNPDDVLQDYKMTRVTFGVSASCFAANMAVKQNAIDFVHKYPLAAESVEKSFYVDDGLTGADDVETAITLFHQLRDLFSDGCFNLRKWNSNSDAVLQEIPPELRECQDVHSISDTNDCTKTLGLEWNTTTDEFHLTISDLPSLESLTKRTLVSDIARFFDVFGWFSPATISMKILLQRLWESGVDWDDPVPSEIGDHWSRWRSELPCLSTKGIPRCYYPMGASACSIQIHGFSDASEDAYAGVVYLRIVNSSGDVHISLVMSKTRVSPIKRLSVPRLELCGAQVLARLLHHTKEVLQLPLYEVFAWTDSTIVLNWLSGNPRRFKTYVGNRVSAIVDLIPPDRWNHVAGIQNPADCASRGLFPSELLNHEIWWSGPPWLQCNPSEWPKQDNPPLETPEELSELCHVTSLEIQNPVVPLNHYSTFSRLQRITAWMLRFIHNCRFAKDKTQELILTPSLSVPELSAAEQYWVVLSQRDQFPTEVASLKAKESLPSNSCLLPLNPYLDSNDVVRVGGREGNARLAYSQLHPMILHGRHPVTKLIIRSEHLRMLHAGPTLLSASLSHRFHIIYLRKTVRSITRQCVTCRRLSARPQPQKMGQLPLERVMPGFVFEKVGVDFAGPFLVKYGMVRKPTLVKAYACIFVSLSVKAVHLEVVSDLTSEAFIATLRRFIARRGYPSLIWSDNGTNFVGADRELQELCKFLEHQKINGAISEFCSANHVEWRFIPERSPNFGGLWEASVKSAKTHLKRVMGLVKFTYEELTTVLVQVEACLNSRPLVPINSHDDDGIQVLTPGHFIIGQPLCALPDPSLSFRSTSLLRRWHLCQCVVRHFWQRWSSEYVVTLNKFYKWHHPSRNLAVGDIVVLKEDSTIPTKWPLARIIQVYPGNDGLVRVASVKTEKGIYKRSVNKLAPLLSHPEP